MEAIVNTIVGYIWGNALVVLSLGVGLYFTLATRGVQFRYLIKMVCLLKENKASKEGISSFQAFCLALSGRVGVGNIAGVATAIAAGGPGAIFWMVVMGLLGELVHLSNPHSRKYTSNALMANIAVVPLTISRKG